jgi:pimeloyl-ACP methyl ester carboxylesterase
MSVSPASRPAFRGELVDVGGRRLRMVRAGARSDRPLVLCEHGAFGCASDWAEVQSRLADKGLRSLAYDRAGLGLSDPGPQPRDGLAMAQDLERLLENAGESGPVVFVGHSMAGLMARVFTRRNRARTVGLVLIDAVTPEMWDVAAPAVRAFSRGVRAAGGAARLGLLQPVSLMFGNLIGLAGEAGQEKRRIWGSRTHAGGSALEVMAWAAISQEAAKEPYDPNLPVAVITAAPERRGAANPLKAMQLVPAERSRHPYVEHVRGSTHASLLGPRHADAIVRGVDHVLSTTGH